MAFREQEDDEDEEVRSRIIIARSPSLHRCFDFTVMPWLFPGHHAAASIRRHETIHIIFHPRRRYLLQGMQLTAATVPTDLV